jgi:hypothetical protein
MFEFFPQLDARQFSRGPSVDRDARSDHTRVESVSRSIERSLRAAQAEETGLVRRLEELTACALVPLGNGTDDYLMREALDNRQLDRLEQEILKGERRLLQLAHDIAHFECLRAALLSGFPGFEPSLRAERRPLMRFTDERP